MPKGINLVAPCSHVHLELGGQGLVFSFRLQHSTLQYTTSSPVDMGPATVFSFFPCVRHSPFWEEVGCRVPILVTEHTC